MTQTTKFDTAAISLASQSIEQNRLTICIAEDGGWACEPADSWLDRQICRITCPVSPVQVAEYIATAEHCNEIGQPVPCCAEFLLW